MSQRPDLQQRAAARLAQREAEGLRRRLRVHAATRPGWIRHGQRECVDFGSNDYLGLAQDRRLQSALRAAAELGVGARASHLLGGHRPEHAALEEALADWLGLPAVLLCSTGYMAAQAALVGLLGRHDLVVQDRLNHACLLDGARLAGARLLRYAHADASAAEALLQAQPERAAMLVTDSVFSMDGDVAPLPELAAVAHRHGALLMLDEAHGLGVLGAQGRGAAALCGLDAGSAPLRLCTFGKALGSFGAALVATPTLIEAIQNFGRSTIYTTAMPPALAAVTLTAVQLARAADAERAQLGLLIQALQRGAQQLQLPLAPSPSPIQALLCGTAARAVDCAQAMLEAGFHAPAVRPPTVPAGSARLRISLSAAHQVQDVERLLEALSSWWRRHGV